MLEYTPLAITAWPIAGGSRLPYPQAAHYRHVLGYFATGVTVITSSYRGQPVGFTANSFCSVSLEPGLVSFCVSNSSSAWPLIKAAGNFCVNILSEDQKDLCAVFASKGVDRFSKLHYSLSPSGAPIIDGVLAWVDCSIVAALPAGDHFIVLGQVHALDQASAGNPLVFCKGKFGTFEAQQQEE